MRCPKCGYNSFEHNKNCPKCRKDLGPTRRLLNLNVPVPGRPNFFALAAQNNIYDASDVAIVEEWNNN